MCGICGKLEFAQDGTVGVRLMRSMLATIRHRGPDDEGVYVSPQIGLGHARLSIIDLSSGHQPLSNETGRIWIVFNGEIYNFHDLRSFLVSKGHVFKTQTDTEVIVHLYEELGPQCVEKLRGMFAFALWDETQRTLLLARDRLGIKPLYYSLSDSSIIFASEMKAILADPAIRRELAPEIIDRFLTFLYVPGEETLFKNISKLAPGHYLLVKDGKAELRRYWDLQFLKSADCPSLQDAERELSELFAESVRLHMIADVPVGILLSGGVDSTAVLGCAAEGAEHQLSSFTVGFSGTGVADERPYAKLAAEACGSQHYDMTISAADFAEFLPGYVWHMEEPVCEPPAVALYSVSKLARQHVKVLLSGEGGDEAFAGYENYRTLVWLERLKQIWPAANGPASRALSRLNSWVDSATVAKYTPLVNATFPNYYYSRTSTPYRYSGNGLGQLYSPEFGRSIDRNYTVEPVRRLFSRVSGQSILDQMLYIDTKTWLPDDLLIKADKMTMANSVELRVPLLDHRLLEFSASLPAHYKLNGFSLKYIWKRALAKRVPEPILNRKKAGFPVPYESWLRKELSATVRDTLTDRQATQRGYFRKSAVEQLINLNQERGAYSKELFSLMTLELWHRTFLNSDRTIFN